jgi:carbamoyl-phosphate synthase large subunit
MKVLTGKVDILISPDPSGESVVVKFSRWAFEKFKNAEDKLGTQIRAVGEVMSIGKTYKEAFQKSIRSLEIGRYGLGFAKDFHKKSLGELMDLLSEPTSERQCPVFARLPWGYSLGKGWWISGGS